MYANSIPTTQQTYPQQGGVYPSGYPPGGGYYPQAPSPSGYIPEAGTYLSTDGAYSSTSPSSYDVAALPPKT